MYYLKTGPLASLDINVLPTKQDVTDSLQVHLNLVVIS